KQVQVYTAEQQKQDFWYYVNNSKYLKDRKGMYAERNGLVAPWSHHFDVRIFQDFYINCKNGQRNTIQVGLDIRNIGNLLNKNWGHYHSINKASILKVSGYAPGSVGQDSAPTYQFQRNGTEVLRDEFSSTIGTGSTWMMQLSLRYIFK
ncbi:MAG: TonB-dependent receptor, partial [Bacteroidales bacterium]|nr:TonB-dependent receptor [Bacteroidales bacterium]